MNSPIKGVIFDFDGLLFDTEPIWDKTYYIFLKNHNIASSEEIEDQMFGRGLTEAVQLMVDKMGLKGNVHGLVADYRELFYEEFSRREDLLMPGVVELLNRLQQNDFVIALTSGGHTKQKLTEILKNHGIIEFFSVIVSSDDVAHGKPAPDVYIEACNQLKLEATDCLAIEDSPNGVKAAKEADVKVYGVNSSEKIRQELKEAGADKVYRSLKDVNFNF